MHFWNFFHNNNMHFIWQLAHVTISSFILFRTLLHHTCMQIYTANILVHQHGRKVFRFSRLCIIYMKLTLHKCIKVVYITHGHLKACLLKFERLPYFLVWCWLVPFRGPFRRPFQCELHTLHAQAWPFFQTKTIYNTVV